MSGRSWLISVGVLLAITLWMGSGYLGSANDESGNAADAPSSPRPMSVQVRESTAESVTRRLENQGETLADRDVEIRAETTGRVVEVLVARGARVSAGEAIARLAMNDREARLEQARAAVAQREGDHEAARRLGDQGLQSGNEVRQAFAALQAARAELAAIRQDIDNTTIRAPFEGVLDRRDVDVGDYLSPGQPVGRVVDTERLRVIINVAQQDIGRVRPGSAATVLLGDGTRMTGEVIFVARAADTDTRTFRVEVAAENPDTVPAGMSATVTLPLDTVSAHFVSPAVLALNDDGVLGVKGVTSDDTIEFHPVELVRSELDGIWVSGPPERLRLVTLGQGFVRQGERVNPVAAADSPTALDAEGRAPVPDPVNQPH